MADTILALTTLGQALKAKIELGGGDIPLEITRIVSAAGSSAYPVFLTELVTPKLEFSVIDSRTKEGRTTIDAILTNIGDEERGIPPLEDGYPLSQIGFYALDPDLGEILYRISQFDNPIPIPAASERGWTYEPTFEIVTENAANVIVQIDTKGLVTYGAMDDAITVAVDGLKADLDAHDTDTKAHQNRFETKADLIDGKVPVAQLPPMDYDPPGSADAAQNQQ
jgi:hypothetical protein